MYSLPSVSQKGHSGFRVLLTSMNRRARTNSSATSIKKFLLHSTPARLADLVRQRTTSAAERRIRQHRAQFAASSTSIDWNQEFELERQRQRDLASITGIEGVLIRVWDNTRPWIVIVTTGIVLGWLVSSIDIISDWLTDVRVGLCRDRWWMSRDVCCMGLENDEICNSWDSWDAILNFRSNVITLLFQYGIYVISGTLFALVSSLLVVSYAPFAYHTGIPEIKAILGGYSLPPFLSFSTLFIKALGLPLAVGSGLSLGKEGPLVHVACCIASVVIQCFSDISGNEAKKREILSAAAAAGISAAFGAPLGGVLFALEEIATFFTGSAMWQSFVCAIISAVTLQYIDPYNTGRLALYELTETQLWRAFEFVPWVFIGVAGGVWGSLFIRLNREWETVRQGLGIRNTRMSGVVEVTCISMFTAVVSYLVVFMKIPSSTLVQHLFHGCGNDHHDEYGVCDTENNWMSVVGLLLVTIVSKTLLTACTIGAAIPAGILFPSLTIGACFGRIVGILTSTLQQKFPLVWPFTVCSTAEVCISPAVYSVLGAASFAGGVTRMTLSLVVIMFELTGAIDLVLQMMIVVMISKFSADVFSKDGVYEMWIGVFSYPFINHKLDYRSDGLTARDVMTELSYLHVLPSRGEMDFGRLKQLSRDDSISGFPVVRQNEEDQARPPVLIGFVSRFDLSAKIEEIAILPYVNDTTACYFENSPPEVNNFVNLSSCVDANPTTLSADTAMEVVVQMFRDFGARYILFTSTGGCLAGLMTKRDVYEHLRAT